MNLSVNGLASVFIYMENRFIVIVTYILKTIYISIRSYEHLVCISWYVFVALHVNSIIMCSGIVYLFSISTIDPLTSNEKHVSHFQVIYWSIHNSNGLNVLLISQDASQ